MTSTTTNYQNDTSPNVSKDGCALLDHEKTTTNYSSRVVKQEEFDKDTADKVDEREQSIEFIKSYSENDLRVYSNPPHHPVNGHDNISSQAPQIHVGQLRSDYVTLEAISKECCRRTSDDLNASCKRIIRQKSTICDLNYKGKKFKKGTISTNTIVVVPSIDLDGDELKRISKGAEHYEERQLYHLLLLSSPSFRVIFVSSHRICEDVVRYYLTLDNCSTVTLNERLGRLFLLTPGDSLSQSKLSDNVLKDQKLITTVRELVARVSDGEGASAGLNVFCGSDTADDLASQLHLRLLEAGGDTLYFGSKQGSREIFRICGVAHAPGTPDIEDEDLLTVLPNALTRTEQQKYIRSPEALSVGIARQIVLKQVRPKQWIVKLNQGFSGRGNAMLDLQEIQNKSYFDTSECQLSEGALIQAVASDIEKKLPEMKFQCPAMSWNGNEYSGYKIQIQKLGVIAEAFFEGDNRTSPSVQAVIEPDCRTGEHCVHLLSTHEQVLDGQVYKGCINPASEHYRRSLLEETKIIGHELAKRGVVGHFAIDFLSSCHGGHETESSDYGVSALEINLRQGGTTHPFATMALLIGGHTDDDGIFRTRDGGPRCYMATDAYTDHSLDGMTSKHFLRKLKGEAKNFCWNHEKKVGVVFHILDFIQLGKIGFTAIAETPANAKQFFNEATEFLHNVANSWQEDKSE